MFHEPIIMCEVFTFIFLMESQVNGILKQCGISDAVQSIKSSGGGCISAAYVVKTAVETYFLKTNDLSFESNFKAEYAGLEHIAATNTVICPKPIAVGNNKRESYILMTYLPSLKSGTPKLGGPLSKMHYSKQFPQFGFPILTFCGSTPLDNAMTDEPWSMWFANHRIGDILRKIGSKNKFNHSIDDIVKKVAEKLQPHDKDVVPSLVHGDLWSGNCGTTNGEPCIYDPACYYGDPEVDLAMTELFGGFGRAFYDEYSLVHPIAPGYKQRKEIYNLYHILNHAHMFGGYYYSEAESIINRLF